MIEKLPDQPVDEMYRFGKATFEEQEQTGESTYFDVFGNVPIPLYNANSGDGKPLRMQIHDTEVREYPEYPSYNHVRHMHTKEDGTKTPYDVWEEENLPLYMEFRNAGYDIRTCKVPSKEVYDAYIARQLGRVGLK